MQETNNITITREVLEITEINLEGNIIPHNWYSAIAKPNGSPDMISIILLSEIVYWYRGIPVKDEATGQFLGYKKKFKEDMLQRSYKSLEDQFGFSKEQIKRSLVRLEQLGLIKRVFKNIELENGNKLTNVMYIKIYPEKVMEITHNKRVAHTSVQKCTEVDTKMHGGYVQNCTEGMCKNARTYTEIISTEITNTDIDNISANAKKDFAFADENDIDNSKKNISTNSSSKHSKSSNELEQRKQQANEIYSEYASLNKESNTAQNKKRAITNITKLLLEFTPEELAAAARNYADYRVKKQIHNPKYIKDPANFYGQRKDSRYFCDFLPGRYEKIEQMATEAEAEDEFERIKENLKDIYGEEE